MRIAVLSDIHGNVHALEAVLEEIEREDVHAVWCLGDVVGYGADPNDCCERIREQADVVLCGNHDMAVTGELSLEEFSRGAAIAARWTQEVLHPDHAAWLRACKPQGEAHGVGLYHGSPRDPVWEYILDESAVRAALDLTSAELVMVGHSHIPIALQLSNGGSLAGGLARGGSEPELTGGRWLLNPGSVGQPRDGDPRAAYLLVDLETRRSHFRRVPYDVEQTQSEIREAGLPEALANRLAEGE
jgi:predicted phosphodiesterase